MDTKTKDFANLILPDWEIAMDRFYSDVQRRMERLGLTTQQVFDALDIGYGDNVADDWVTWMGADF